MRVLAQTDTSRNSVRLDKCPSSFLGWMSVKMWRPVATGVVLSNLESWRLVGPKAWILQAQRAWGHRCHGSITTPRHAQPSRGVARFGDGCPTVTAQPLSIEGIADFGLDTWIRYKQHMKQKLWIWLNFMNFKQHFIIWIKLQYFESCCFDHIDYYNLAQNSKFYLN
jgi:hypothetical protein